MGEKKHTGVKNIPVVGMKLYRDLADSCLETMKIYFTGSKILMDKVNP